MPNGRPPGFSMTPAEFFEQVIQFEKVLTEQGRPGEEIRRAPLADFLRKPKPDHSGLDSVSLVTMNKWLAGWGVPMPPWPRDFLDDQGNPVLICAFDGRPPFRVQWISPNCEALLGRPQEYYIGNPARQLRLQPDTLWQRQPEMHEARERAQAVPGVPFSAATTLSTADGLELPVEWTFRYGEHQTPRRARTGRPSIGMFYCCIVKAGEARSPMAHMQQRFFSAESADKVSQMFDENTSLRSVTFGRDEPTGARYVEVRGTLTWDDLRRQVRQLNGIAHGRATALGTLSVVEANT